MVKSLQTFWTHHYLYIPTLAYALFLKILLIIIENKRIL